MSGAKLGASGAIVIVVINNNIVIVIIFIINQTCKDHMQSCGDAGYI